MGMIPARDLGNKAGAARRDTHLEQPKPGLASVRFASFLVS